jgi:hypothetical protein
MGNTYGEIAQRPVLVVAEQPHTLPDPRSVCERADRNIYSYGALAATVSTAKVTAIRTATV